MVCPRVHQHLCLNSCSFLLMDLHVDVGLAIFQLHRQPSVQGGLPGQALWLIKGDDRLIVIDLYRIVLEKFVAQNPIDRDANHRLQL